MTPYQKLMAMLLDCFNAGTYSFKLPPCPDVGLGLRRFTVSRLAGGGFEWTYASMADGAWCDEHWIAPDHMIGNIAELLAVQAAP